MGLDMWLFVEKYESKTDIEADYPKGFYPKEVEPLGKKLFGRCHISITKRYLVGYWRNFYPLHRWFRKLFFNHSEGYLDPNELKDLLSVLKYMKAHELTEYHGFDFKVDDERYDKDYYLSCLNYTIDLFERVLRFTNKNADYDIYYIGG